MVVCRDCRYHFRKPYGPIIVDDRCKKVSDIDPVSGKPVYKLCMIVNSLLDCKMFKQREPTRWERFVSWFLKYSIFTK